MSASRKSGGVTISDVASEAGVSITTVSRFMNGHYQHMSAEVRERLHETVDRLGYVPNAMAQKLKGGRSALIGVVLSNIAHPYWSAVVSGVVEGCRDFGYGAVISSASDKADVERRYLDIYQRQHIDGLLLNPTHATPKMMERWVSLPYPVVALDRTLPDLHFDLVAIDNLLGIKLAVRHLLELGHRKIGYVSWDPYDLSNRCERLQGYTQALQEAGIGVDSDCILFAEERSGDATEKTKRMFQEKDRPTAVVCASGLLNLEVLVALKQLGLRVPSDVSVVGYDQSPWDSLLECPLTTVSTPAYDLGMTAAKHLCQCIVGQVVTQGHEIRLKPRLVVRESTTGV